MLVRTLRTPFIYNVVVIPSKVLVLLPTGYIMAATANTTAAEESCFQDAPSASARDDDAIVGMNFSGGRGPWGRRRESALPPMHCMQRVEHKKNLNSWPKAIFVPLAQLHLNIFLCTEKKILFHPSYLCNTVFSRNKHQLNPLHPARLIDRVMRSMQEAIIKNWKAEGVSRENQKAVSIKSII